MKQKKPQTAPQAQTPGTNWVLYLSAGILIIVLIGAAALGLYAFGSTLRVTPCVGVLNVNGEITTEDSPRSLFSEGVAGSATIAQAIEDANSSPSIKALLIVVDSPGGSVVASREIYEAVKDFKKPKVVYFREVAASGGYYISAPADYIVSNPDALTASIGVRATVSDLSSLFEKIGYNETTFKSGEFKDIGSASRPMTDEEASIFQNITSEIFTEFKKVVTDGRKGKLRNTEEIFDARIMTGRQAYAHGLVDAIGSRKDALKKAAELAKIEGEPQECSLDPSRAGGFGGLLSGASETFWGGFFAAAKSAQASPKVSYS
jgi:protease-4